MRIHFDCAEEFPSPIGYAYTNKASKSRAASDTGTAGGSVALLVSAPALPEPGDTVGQGL